jgi:hypothetical protein
MQFFAHMLFVYLARGEGDLQYQYHAYCDTSLFEMVKKTLTTKITNYCCPCMTMFWTNVLQHMV